VKIAELLCRAGLHLAPTTVARMLKEEPPCLEPLGAVGKHGSIAIVERFIRSMKHECTRRLVVPLRREGTRREIAFYAERYNTHVPTTPSPFGPRMRSPTASRQRARSLVSN